MIPMFKRWKMFLFTAFMYGILGISTSMLSAISQMTDEQFNDVITNNVRSRHYWLLVFTCVSAFITNIRALMNKDYHDTVKGGPTT